MILYLIPVPYLVNLKSIDVSKNTKLIYFYCGGNELSDLDVSKNILLESMGCAYNKIKVICVVNLNQVSDLWSKDETAVYKVCP